MFQRMLFSRLFREVMTKVNIVLTQSISTKEGFSIHGITESGQGHAAILEKD